MLSQFNILLQVVKDLPSMELLYFRIVSDSGFYYSVSFKDSEALFNDFGLSFSTLILLWSNSENFEPLEKDLGD